MHSALVRRASLIATGAVIVGLAAAVPAQAAGITPPVNVTTQPADTTVNQGSDASFSAAATDATPADVPVAEWDVKVPGGSFVAVPSSAGLATLVLHTGPALNPEGTLVHAVFDDGNGGTITSSDATLHVHVGPAITTQPTNHLVGPSSVFHLDAAASGSPAPTVQWQSSSTQGGSYTDVPSATSTTLTATSSSNVGDVTWYRAVFTNSVSSVTSDAVSVTVTSGVPGDVTSVTPSNPAPGTLGVAWTPAASGPAATSYEIVVKDQSATVLTTKTVPASQLSISIAVGVAYVDAEVTAINDTGRSNAVASSFINVYGLVQSATVTGTVLRTFHDGFEDSVVARASSNFAVTGLVRVRNAKHVVVRSYPFSSRKAFLVAINGRTAAGKLLPLGTYYVDIYLGSKLITTKSFRILSSAVGSVRTALSAATVYPVKDGYLDSTKLTVTTDVPATVSVVITNRKGAKVAAYTLRRGALVRYVVWSARTSHGVLPAGSYKATITVKGGEGKARIAKKSIAVSGKYLHPVNFTGSISALAAYAFPGTNTAQCDSSGSSIGAFSAPGNGSGCVFGAKLPASALNKYTNVKLFACTSNSGGGGSPAELDALDKGFNVRAAYALAQGSGCRGGAYPAAALQGRLMVWGVYYGGQDNTDYWVDYFKVSFTMYVLK